MTDDSVCTIAKKLTKAERACLLTWGAENLSDRASIPDSIWFGKLSHLKCLAAGSANGFALSSLGLAVRALMLKGQAHEQP